MTDPWEVGEVVPDSSVLPRVPAWFEPAPAALAALAGAAETVLVQAPPGFGKTGTVATWLAAEPGRLWAWVDVDLEPGVERFLADVRARLERIREFSSVVTDPDAAAGAARVTLVIDRLDRLPMDGDARLAELARAAGAQLVIIARRSRALRSFRESCARITLVDEEHLRLGSAQVHAIAGSLDRGLRPGQADALVARTRGWPGAVIAALRDAQLPPPEPTPWRPGAILLGYAQTILLDPEFHRQSDLLRLLSVVGDVTDDLVADVLGPAPGTLAAFSNEGPVALERAGDAWRLGPVLAPALADLYERMEPAAIRRVNARLHVHYAGRGDLGRALTQAILSADADLLREFVEAHWSELAVLAPGRLERALGMLGPVSDLTRFLAAEVIGEAGMRRGRRGLVDGTFLLPGSAPDPGEGIAGGAADLGPWRLRWAWAQFFARRHLGAADAFWRLSGHPDPRLRGEAWSGLALCLLHRGFVRAARDWWIAGDGPGGREPATATARACDWLVRRLLFDEGRPVEDRVPGPPGDLADLPPATADLGAYIELLVLLPTRRASSTEEDLDHAAERCARAAAQSPTLRTAITMTYVHRLVTMGRLARAREVLADTSDMAGWDMSAKAWIDWLEGNLVGVLRITGASLPGAGLVDEETRLNPRLHAQLLVLDALGSARLGRADRATNMLDAALELTRESGYWRAWSYVPPSEIARLVELLPALADVFDGAPVGAPGPEPLRGMVRLSPRELDVLRQWSQDHTVAEIADRLFVSVNSVKSHLRSIYKKLNVTGRGDALERARQLALIP
ncbi:hypothetical protein GCG21_12725 [Pseudactinotalea sp. HY160]|uniref:helix-turn-helix transcriptional regulator n=1 Tax=Pseudactinotalea sp. HY160 TaxID=2654490 RepID=UPI00128D7B19|nr:hypothetical protein [Pseudactinotalea sp. HY160]